MTGKWDKMMGRGADGGCGTEEKPCPVRLSPAAKTPANFPASTPEKPEKVRLGLDFYTQASKALSERSPFDSDEVLATTSPTLPSGLAGLLSRHSDSKRKHKRGHWDAKSKRKGSSEKSKGSNLWAKLEEYFREVTLPDIERLNRLSSSLGPLAGSGSSTSGSDSCFSVPVLVNEIRNGDSKGDINKGSDDDKNVGNVNGNDASVLVVKDEEVIDADVRVLDSGGSVLGRQESGEDVQVLNSRASELRGQENGEEVRVSDSGASEPVRVSDTGASELRGLENGGDGQHMEIDTGSREEEQHIEIDNGSRDSFVTPQSGPSPEASLQPCSSVEWILGSRNRVLLATTRPSKKRKLLGETAGLERLIVAQPCEGSMSLCHVCSMGDTGDQSNQLVICKSCNVVVHQKCYGVHGEVEAPWLCSWCKHNRDDDSEGAAAIDRPCVLCPKLGGALKPSLIAGSGNNGSSQFVHLFCSQWMPEVYVDDTRLMEPVLGVEGIKDVRGKLVCNLCKIKLGSCVRCSDGSCRTSFHPICAREARNKLEIWGKFGSDDIEMRAFCSKHSGTAAIAGTGGLVKNVPNHGVSNDSLGTSNQPVSSVNKIKKLKIGCRNGDKVIFHIGTAEAKLNSLGDHESQEMVMKDAQSLTKLEKRIDDGCGLTEVQPFQRTFGENAESSAVLDLCVVLRKLVDLGKVSLEQVASETGISVDSLTSKLTDNHLDSDLYYKILKWLKDHADMDTLQKDSDAKLKCLIPSKRVLGADGSLGTSAIRELDVSDAVPVKSVPPRRRTVGNIQILTDDKYRTLWSDKLLGNGAPISNETGQQLVNSVRDNSNKDSSFDSTDQMMVGTGGCGGCEDSMTEPSPTSENSLLKSKSGDVEPDRAEEGTSSGKSSLLDVDQEIPSCSSVITVGQFDGDMESGDLLLCIPTSRRS